MFFVDDVFVAQITLRVLIHTECVLACWNCACNSFKTGIRAPHISKSKVFCICKYHFEADFDIYRGSKYNICHGSQQLSSNYLFQLYSTEHRGQQKRLS